MLGQKVRVHYALTGPNAGRWSITQRGKVVANVDGCVVQDATPVISEKMRQRVSHPKGCGCSSKCGRRTVHAWIEGILIATDSDTAPIDGARVVSYNPRTAAHFYHVDDSTPFDGAPVVVFTPGTVNACR